MKFTMATMLAAAVATVSSAALQPLPAKFTLVFTSGSADMNKYTHDITIDLAWGSELNMGGPNQEEQDHVAFVPVGDGAAWTTAGNWRVPNPLTISTAGQLAMGNNPSVPKQVVSFGQVNGAFGVNGSTSKWSACPWHIKDTWVLYWDVAGCVPISVNVVAA